MVKRKMMRSSEVVVPMYVDRWVSVVSKYCDVMSKRVDPPKKAIATLNHNTA